MAFGIEARVPFLDHRVVELGLALPDRLKIDARSQKVALRRAFADVIPLSVLSRRDKIGFASPEGRWLRAWRPSLQPLLSSPRSEELGLIKSGGVADVFDLWARGKLKMDVLWRVLVLEMWCRVSIAGEALPIATMAASG